MSWRRREVDVVVEWLTKRAVGRSVPGDPAPHLDSTQTPCLDHNNPLTNLQIALFSTLVTSHSQALPVAGPAAMAAALLRRLPLRPTTKTKAADPWRAWTVKVATKATRDDMPWHPGSWCREWHTYGTYGMHSWPRRRSLPSTVSALKAENNPPHNHCAALQNTVAYRLASCVLSSQAPLKRVSFLLHVG